MSTSTASTKVETEKGDEAPPLWMIIFVITAVVVCSVGIVLTVISLSQERYDEAALMAFGVIAGWGAVWSMVTEA